MNGIGQKYAPESQGRTIGQKKYVGFQNTWLQKYL
jgi:hypothetical protein